MKISIKRIEDRQQVYPRMLFVHIEKLFGLRKVLVAFRPLFWLLFCETRAAGQDAIIHHDWYIYPANLKAHRITRIIGQTGRPISERHKHYILFLNWRRK